MTGGSVPRLPYGPDPSQFGELTRPGSRERPATIMLLHGGFWRSRIGLDHLADAARDLAGRGWTVWNVEYRRVGSGGGAPGSLEDVGRALDRLASLDDVPDTVVAVGHSAGGHLATWLGSGRRSFGEGTDVAPATRPAGIVSLAGVLDLGAAHAQGLGEGAVGELMGGTPAELPDLYRWADPLRAIPLDVPVRCVHARADERVPLAQSETYVASARAVGMDAVLVEAAGDHFSIVQPGARDWELVVAVLDDLVDEVAQRS